MIVLAVLMQASSFTFRNAGRDALEIGWNRPIVIARAPRISATWTLDSRPAEPLYLGYPHGPKDAQFVPTGRKRDTYVIQLPPFHGHISASGDAFVCSTDPNMPLGSSYGRPEVLSANGVYDRAADWLVTFEGMTGSIRPARSGFDVSSTSPCVLKLRSNYYRDHLSYFLWDRSGPLWKQPVAGWCSWMAHLQDVKEDDVLAASRFFSANLKDYGYDVIQIDDGYQRVKQFGQESKGKESFSSYWTKPNEKFPHGMGWLAHQIRALGMTPGIWIGYYLPLGLKHEDGYVLEPDGKPHKGPWVNYAVNGLDKEARNEAYIDTVRAFKQQGWDYFKIDTLRHVLYDSYRQVPSYWQSQGQSMEEAYRRILSETKKAAGDSYVLACWGTIPELAGLADGARIGEDVGPDFDSMRRSAKYIAQFHYLNNVVWRNDPDYMCFRVPIEQARTWATLTFMAGGHVMVSDPIAAYDAPHLDALRRVGPPIYTRPANVISHRPDPEFMTLSIEKGGEQWTVVARMAWSDMPAVTVPAGRFGLSGGSHLAFDFWNEKYLGAVQGDVHFAALAKGSCQVVCFRRETDRPQVLSTNRHLAQGIVELDGVSWKNRTLSGCFLRKPGQKWSLYVHVPSNWGVVNVLPLSIATEQSREVLKLTFPEGKEPVDFAVKFDR